MQLELPALMVLLGAGLAAACNDSAVPRTAVSASVTVSPAPNATGASVGDTVRTCATASWWVTGWAE